MQADNGRSAAAQAQSFDAPPSSRQGAVTKTITILRKLSLGTGVVFGFTMMAELLFTPALKPSALMGHFAGATETAEINAKKDAAVEFAGRQAFAAITPQMEAEAFRKQQEIIGDSLSVESGMAKMFDFGCMVGALVPRDANRDWQQVGESLRSACGVGDEIRTDMVNQLARAGRNGSAVIQRPRPTP